MSYVVRCVRETGTIIYHCRSTRSAFEKLHDFRRAEYRDITVSLDDERAVSESDLAAMLARDSTDQIHA